MWNGGEKCEAAESAAGRKRESLKGGSRIGTDRAWRSPKRQRPTADVGFSQGKGVFGFGSLEASLRDVCSFEDLVERMGMYLSPDSQNEVLSVMSRVVKVSFYNLFISFEKKINKISHSSTWHLTSHAQVAMERLNMGLRRANCCYKIKW